MSKPFLLDTKDVLLNLCNAAFCCLTHYNAHSNPPEAEKQECEHNLNVEPNKLNGKDFLFYTGQVETDKSNLIEENLTLSKLHRISNELLSVHMYAATIRIQHSMLESDFIY